MSELSVGQIQGLPVNDNVVTVPSGHTLYAPGHVLQVVNSSYNAEVVNNSTTFAATGLSATITPKFATSKILVVANQVGLCKWVGSNIYNHIRVELRRDSTVLSYIYDIGYNESSGYLFGFTAPMTVLDSPNTTSPITYAMFFRNSSTGSDSRANRQATSSMTLMEIAA